MCHCQEILQEIQKHCAAVNQIYVYAAIHKQKKTKTNPNAFFLYKQNETVAAVVYC